MYRSLLHLPASPFSPPPQYIATSPAIRSALLAGVVNQAAAETVAELLNQKHHKALIQVNTPIRFSDDKNLTIQYRRGDIQILATCPTDAPDDPGELLSLARLCVVCWYPLEPGARSDAKACSTQCRSALSLYNQRHQAEQGGDHERG